MYKGLLHMDSCPLGVLLGNVPTDGSPQVNIHAIIKPLLKSVLLCACMYCECLLMKLWPPLQEELEALPALLTGAPATEEPSKKKQT